MSGQSGCGSWARMTTSARGGALSSTAVLLLSSVFSVGEVVVLLGEGAAACSLDGRVDGGMSDVEGGEAGGTCLAEGS